MVKQDLEILLTISQTYNNFTDNISSVFNYLFMLFHFSLSGNFSQVESQSWSDSITTVVEHCAALYIQEEYV